MTAVLPSPVRTRAPRPSADAALASASALIGARSAAAFDRAAELRRNNVIHIIFIIAIAVLLLLAASLVAAAIILCAQHGGVLNFLVKLDPWTVKVDCVKLR